MNDKILSFLGICRRAKKLVIGADSAVQSAQNGKSKLILCARDFSQSSLRRVREAAEQYGVPVHTLPYAKEELSHALGKLCGVLSIEDSGFAAKLTQMLSQDALHGDTQSLPS